MTPNTRKRGADDTCNRVPISKSPRLSHSQSTSVLPEHQLRSHLIDQPSHPRQSLQLIQDHAVTSRPVSRAKLASNTRSTSTPISQPLSNSRHQPPDTTCTSGTSSLPVPASHAPAVLHREHPESKLGQDFHWVPYPLGLMPYDSWHRLHHKNNVQPPLPFRCPVCRQERIATAHMRKVFLVAERLSWNIQMVSTHERDLNEELNWAVNYELGILDPVIEDQGQVPGGKFSSRNKFYPYQNEHEMKLALRLIFMTEDITTTTWALWIGAQLSLQKVFISSENEDVPPDGSRRTSMPESQGPAPSAISSRHLTPEPIETIDLTGSPDPPSRSHGKSHVLPTPPSSFSKTPQDATTTSKQHEPTSTFTTSPGPPVEHSLFHPKRIRSYKTLQDFYSLLDKIERNSYVGALFLEAYAEKLRDDMCKTCWLKHNINLDAF
jgi:hypothetical protein